MIYDITGKALSGEYDQSGQASAPAYRLNGAVFNGATVKIMTYNVGGWYDGTGQNVPAAKDEAYFRLQYGTIADNDPDILFVNEYWDQFSKKPRTAMSFLSELFPYIEARHGTEMVLGRCVCSKFPLRDYTERIFEDDAPDDRYYDTVIADVNGRDVTLCMTFFWWNDPEIRKMEAEILVPFLQSLDMPFICAGDLNTGRVVDNTQVIKPMLDAGFVVCNRATFGSFVTYYDTLGSGGMAGVDNIIFSPDFSIKKIYTDNRKELDGITTETIDHMPLLAIAEI